MVFVVGLVSMEKLATMGSERVIKISPGKTIHKGLYPFVWSYVFWIVL